MLILDLLRKGEFPRIHYPSFESREVSRLLRYRHKLPAHSPGVAETNVRPSPSKQS
jgi:hypothetical protein